MGSNQAIIGTAGHIDHGKTELIKALTGIDADRLKEEKERGMTIDLGFAWLELPDGRRFGIIDVPGHERFIPNMLVGATSIDYVIFVVAADEGIMPQSIEHLQILQILEVKQGVTVVTKEDLVNESELTQVVGQIQQSTRGSFLQESPIKIVSSKTGKGIKELKQLLLAELARIDLRRPEGVFRMPIDRVFDVKGFGCVATGSVIQGTVNSGSDVMIYPLEKTARVRGVQTQNRKVEKVEAGQRAAINLAGVRSQDIYRGCELSLPHRLMASHFIDVHFNYLQTNDQPLKSVTEVKLYRGTQETLARLVLLDVDKLPPGQGSLAQLRLNQKIVAQAGDPFVIRLCSPPVTIGGGKVLRLSSRKTARKSSLHIAGLRLLQDKQLRQYCQLMLEHSAPVVLNARQIRQLLQFELEKIDNVLNQLAEQGIVTRWQAKTEKFYIIDKKLRLWWEKVSGYLDRFHRQNPLLPGCSLKQLQSELSLSIPLPNLNALFSFLQSKGRLKIAADQVSLPEFKVSLTAAQLNLKQKVEQIYHKASLKPVNLEDLYSQLRVEDKVTDNEITQVANMLLKEGALIKIKDDMVFHRAAVGQLIKVLYQSFKPQQPFRVTEFKTLFNLTRKYAIPLMEYLDGRGVTLRKGEIRFLLPPKSSTTED